MNFYTYQYLVNNQRNNQYIKMGIISVLIVIFGYLLYRYLKNRWAFKYKDLAVIAGTFLLLLLSMQYSDYINLQANNKRNDQITGVFRQASKQLDVQSKQMLISDPLSNNNNDRLLKTPKGYFRLIFNQDSSSFLVQKVTLVRPKIHVVEGS